MVELQTRGQLERTLSQKIQAYYRQQLGHQPSKISCQLFDNQLAIIVEDSITPAEKLLLKEGKEALAEKVRFSLNDATKPELKSLIQEILAVNVTDILSDATLDTGRTGIIAVLENSPQVRNSNSSSKPRRKSMSSPESN
ncbi:MAG: DUF2294 domain-containing protein [Microcoleaceae cyanobacterium]